MEGKGLFFENTSGMVQVWNAGRTTDLAVVGGPVMEPAMQPISLSHAKKPAYLSRDLHRSQQALLANYDL